jgi:hypothetical protein
MHIRSTITSWTACGDLAAFGECCDLPATKHSHLQCVVGAPGLLDPLADGGILAMGPVDGMTTTSALTPDVDRPKATA